MIRTLTGYAQDAYNAGNMGLRRTRLTRSGLFDGVEVLTSAPCFSLFGPSVPRPEAPTMAAADFCIVTATIAGRRAVNLHDVAASFFDTQRTARHGARFLVSRCEPFRVSRHPNTPLAAQISPGKNANSPCANASFTLSVKPLGFAVQCQLASTLQAFYVVSVRRLARLHSGFLQTNPHGSALAVG